MVTALRRSLLTIAVTALALGASVATAPSSGAETETHTVTFSGPDLQQFVVSDGVTELVVEAFGAQGGTGGTCENDGCGAGGEGGLGSHITAVIPVTPGETLTVIVGGRGGDGPLVPDSGQCPGTLLDGGQPGLYQGGAGGQGGCPAAPGGGGGGWAALVRGDPSDPSDRVVLVGAAAGGGGGGGGNEDSEISQSRGWRGWRQRFTGRGR